MDRTEALKYLTGGPDGVLEWNRKRKSGEPTPSLNDIDLRDLQLYGRASSDIPMVIVAADLHEVSLAGANLRGANLEYANLSRVNLSNADISGASLRSADLSRSDLSRLVGRGADLWGANLRNCKLGAADLSDAVLIGVQFNSADLQVSTVIGADARSADFSRAYMRHSDLRFTKLERAKFRGSYLYGSRFAKSELQGAFLEEAELSSVDLAECDLSHANLTNAILHKTNLKGADLNGANLTGAHIIGANLVDSNMTGCEIYGLSAWDLSLDGAIQTNLTISPGGEPSITLDNIEVAQFIYLLLNNTKLRQVIDTITSKIVLILGRFTPARKTVLDAIRHELRRRNYLPVLFDFDKPRSRDITETVSTLAHLSRFIVVDLTDAKSVPQELQAVIPHLPSVPVQPILLAGEREYSMFEHYKRYPWVLTPVVYRDSIELLDCIEQKVIQPAELKAKELRT